MLGFGISAVLQVFVSKDRMTREFGTTSFRSVTLATAFGGASSSCSQAILGYSRRIGIDNELVTDFVRSQDQFQGQNSNTVELGLRHQVMPQTLYAVGVGAGSVRTRRSCA